MSESPTVGSATADHGSAGTSASSPATTSVAGSTAPLVEARGIIKRYGHAEALRGADFTVHPNEVVALVGDNGAGKSTLVRILSGVERPTAGDLLIDGTPMSFDTTVDAREHGIETIYQDLALAPHLDAAANMHLGREVLRGGVLGRLGFLDKKAMRESARRSFSELGMRIGSVDTPVSDFSGGQRQGVAVARAAAWASRVIIMDEPTAALGVVQTRQVLNLIGKVKAAGKSVVLISHNMPEVLQVADRIEVLRLGTRVAQFTATDVTITDIVRAMTGGLSFEDDDE